MNNEKQKLKVGDLVYYPSRGGGIYTLEEKKDGVYVFVIDAYLRPQFTKEGYAWCGNKNPAIFHATTENHAKLESFFDVEFEKPPLTGSDLVRAMLESDWHSVNVWFSSRSDNAARKYKNRDLATSYADGNFELNHKGTRIYCIPFDPQTGKELTAEVLNDK